MAQEDVVQTGLTEEGEEELDETGSGEGRGEDVAGTVAARELAEEHEGEEDCGNGGVEGDGMEAGGIGRDRDAPGGGGGRAGVAAFGEGAGGEKGPGEGGTGGPGVERGEHRKGAGSEEGGGAGGRER